MTALITASAVRTCFGDGAATFAALLAGSCGVSQLRFPEREKLNVARGYHIGSDDGELPLRASAWLTTCVEEAVRQAGLDLARQRVVALVGTGLRELRLVERMDEDDWSVATEHLHFGRAVRAAAPGIERVVTICNACSAGGHALAIAEDILALDTLDAVIVAGVDGMTASMLAMIGRVSAEPTREVRPFDDARQGVLLGESAAALVLVRAGGSVKPLVRLLGSGLSCDAHHETAPHADGITRAMRDARARALVEAEQIGLVLAHGTGTLLNDPLEATLIQAELGRPDGPLVAAAKGAVGHGSGAAALVNVDVAIRCLHSGRVPPIVGLRRPLEEARGLHLVAERAAQTTTRVAQINAFGFGGVNAVNVITPPGAEAGAGLVTSPAVGVAVTGWSLLLPHTGLRTLGDGFDTGASPMPVDAQVLLGRKGLLFKDPATRLALCAVHVALGLAPGAPRWQGPADPRTAVVVSSNFGNVAGVRHVVETVSAGSGRDVSLMEAPNVSSNVVASSIAIWFRYGGPNVMLCSGAPSGLDAVDLGCNLLRAGRADRVVVVGVEPADDTAATLHARRAAVAGRAAAPGLKEGAAAVILSRASEAQSGVPLLGPIRAAASIPAFVAACGVSVLLGPREAASGSVRALDLLRSVGDLYGATGVVQVAVAAQILAGRTSADRRGVAVLCGDAEDGWRSMVVRGGRPS